MIKREENTGFPLSREWQEKSVCMGMTSEKCLQGNDNNGGLSSSFRRNDKKGRKYWIPAFAGMTREKCLHGNDKKGGTGFPLSREWQVKSVFAGMTREKCLQGNDKKREENTGFPFSRGWKWQNREVFSNLIKNY